MYLHTLDLHMVCLECQKNVQVLEHLVGELPCWRSAIEIVVADALSKYNGLTPL